MSHHHPDHTILAGIFEKAKCVTFDARLIYDKDIILKFDKHTLGKDVEIVETPGHTLEDLSLLVSTPQGMVAVAGDAIWWIDGEEQLFDINQKDHSQAKGMNIGELIESRKKLLENADYIIPGHGKMFKVQK